MINLCWVRRMWQARISFEIHIPTPLLEFFRRLLTPFILDDLVLITMTHEDLRILKNVQPEPEMLACLQYTLFGFSTGTMSLILPCRSK